MAHNITIPPGTTDSTDPNWITTDVWPDSYQQLEETMSKGNEDVEFLKFIKENEDKWWCPYRLADIHIDPSLPDPVRTKLTSEQWTANIKIA